MTVLLGELCIGGRINRLELELRLTSDDLNTAESYASDFVKLHGGDELCAYNFSYAVRECIANSMNYENKCKSGTNVHLKLYRLGKKFIAYVEDSGTEHVDTTPYFNLDLDDPDILLSTHGRGLFLAKKFTDEEPFFIYSEKGKKIRLVKNLTNSSHL